MSETLENLRDSLDGILASLGIGNLYIEIGFFPLHRNSVEVSNFKRKSRLVNPLGYELLRDIIYLVYSVAFLADKRVEENM